MAPSAPSTKAKRVRPKLTSGQKQLRRQKFADLTNEVNQARENYQESARTIAEKHGRSHKWTRSQLFLGRTRRRGNPWNAFVRRKLKEANDDLDVGERYRLPKFIAENRESLKRDYRKLTAAEKISLAKELNIVREEKAKVVRANPKALQHDVNATFAAMEREWTAIVSRTGIQGFYLAVRGSVEDYHEPKVFFSDRTMKFVKEILGIEPKQLALKLEAWCVSGLDQGSSTTRHPKRVQVISNCRVLIQDGLDDILRENNLTKAKIVMNYDNYEMKIVEKYGVALKGWPTGQVRNPGKVGGRRDITRLYEALSSGACSWVTLTDEEIDKRKKENQAREDRGESVYKARRASAKKKKAFKSRETIADDNDEPEEQQEQGSVTEGQGDVQGGAQSDSRNEQGNEQGS